MVRVPTEIVKQRLQAGIHSSMEETISHIIKSDGFKGFYRGYGTTIMREVIYIFCIIYIVFILNLLYLDSILAYSISII